MSEQRCDVLIIGQGLAGSLLAYECIQQGLQVQVLDAGTPGSSYAAAGLFNPITGRKMVKTWQADVLFDHLLHYYPKVEAALGVRFFHPTPIYRPLLSVAEYNDWHGRWGEPQYAPYVERVTDPDTYGQHVYDTHGGLLLQRSGWVDLPTMLQAFRAYLTGRGCWQQHSYQPGGVVVDGEGVTYAGIRARHLVHCTGTQAAADHWWSWLPFRLVKGEVLEISTPEPLPRIYNRGVFVLPVATNRARVGSTYHHQELTLVPTERGRQELEQKLQALLRVPYTVVDHWAGIRPATKDRRPLLGRHPSGAPVWICNGLGAKGVSLAPYFVAQLVKCITAGESLWPEVDINRFATYY